MSKPWNVHTMLCNRVVETNESHCHMATIQMNLRIVRVHEKSISYVNPFHKVKTTKINMSKKLI